LDFTGKLCSCLSSLSGLVGVNYVIEATETLNTRGQALLHINQVVWGIDLWLTFYKPHALQCYICIALEQVKQFPSAFSGFDFFTLLQPSEELSELSTEDNPRQDSQCGIQGSN